MTTSRQDHSRRWARPALGALIASIVAGLPAGARAVDPITIGAGQRPFVVVLVDSSASMEFGAEGEQEPICHERAVQFDQRLSCDLSEGRPDTKPPRNASNTPANAGDPSIFDWEPGDSLAAPSDPDPYDRTEMFGSKGYEDADEGAYFVGPCYVWKDLCADYVRPPWAAEVLEEGSTTAHAQDEYGQPMWQRLRAMRGELDGGGGIAPGLGRGVRLRDDNQPRHVQIKEILTGDMLLRPWDPDTNAPAEDFSADPELHGPGCWFVPRMANNFNSPLWHICQQVNLDQSPPRSQACTTDADCDTIAGARCRQVEQGSSICVAGTHENAFWRMVDYDDPRPHYQEVYDYQLGTGLLDNLANTAIFAVAMFDGARGRVFENNFNDPMAPVLDQAAFDPARPVLNDGIPDFGALPMGLRGGETEATYNLGVYRVVGPTQLDLPSSLLNGLSSFVQYAITDAGYLRNGSEPGFEIDPLAASSSPAPRLSYTFPAGLKRYVLPYQMGKQPIAGGTPLAAAVRDIHRYMVRGQREFDASGRVLGASSEYDPTDRDDVRQLRRADQNFIVNPVQTDPYRECRPKHVVLMTDGFPEPERAGELTLGSDRLSSQFGYDDWDGSESGLERYPYETAETEIRAFVQNPTLRPPNPALTPQYVPQLHVVGLNIAGAQACVEESDCDFGQRCIGPAGQRRCISDSNGNGIADGPEKLGRMAREGGTCALHHLLQGDGKKFVPQAWGGTCDPDDPDAPSNCLVQQLPDNTSYTYRSTRCIAPALVLERNDRFRADEAREVRDDLTEALGLIFNEVLERSGGIASRTRPTITNSLDDTTRAGQYRVFSGVDVSGSNLYWKGLLERQTIACASAGGSIESASSSDSLHDEINQQVELQESGTFRDNRRIFTSISRVDMSNGALIREPTNKVIFSPYPLETVSAAIDDFGDARFVSANRSKALTRVPFELDTMIDEATFPDGATPRQKRSRLLGTANLRRARRTVNTVRGRVEEKLGRAFGPILNSNPVAVGPPALDLPIDSYRAYRQKYGERSTMLYVATLDGLLHAIHAGPNTSPGERGVIRRGYNGADGATASAVSDTTGAPPQREAWAYAPEMLRRQYYANLGRQPNLLDGTPVVADVRLCHQNPALNQNEQACGAATASDGVGGSVVPPAEQWRTVLVQGAGQAGSGYFALDVTQSGGLIDGAPGTMPDPIALWEFDFDWERLQLAAMRENGTVARYDYNNSIENPAPALPTSTSACSGLPSSGPQRVNEIADLPYLGLSVGDAAIGTVALDGLTIDDGGGPIARRVQRPVALFSAGLSGELPGASARGQIPSDCLSDERRGRALYIVDLQTGSMLRRFVDYYDPKLNKSYRFQGELVGTPVLYDGRPGVVASRGYVGDAAGRLFRVDLSSADPLNWRMELMYDPCEDDQLKSGAGIDDADCELLTTNEMRDARRPFGPASFAPKVALDRDRSVVIVYGLGERGESSTAGQTQAMIALRETPQTSLEPRGRQIIWRTSFPEDTAQPLREKLTGEPVIFNFGVYFTTYVEQSEDACVPGTTRVWGLQLGGNGSGRPAGALFFADGGAPPGISLAPNPDEGLYRYYEPQVAQLLRGASIAFRPDCSVDLTNANPALAGAAESSRAVPELIVTTGTNENSDESYDPSGANADLSTGSSGALNYGVKRLAAPTSQLRPLSWAIIGR